MRAVITAAKRTVIGRQNGFLKTAEPHELAAALIKYLEKPLNGNLNEVILGNVVGPGAISPVYQPYLPVFLLRFQE